MYDDPVMEHPLFQFPVSGVIVDRRRARAVSLWWWHLVLDADRWGEIMALYHGSCALQAHDAGDVEASNYHQGLAESIEGEMRKLDPQKPLSIFAKRILTCERQLDFAEIRAHAQDLMNLEPAQDQRACFVLDGDRGTLIVAPCLTFLAFYQTRDVFLAVAPEPVVAALGVHMLDHFGGHHAKTA